jgi:proteasome lid subunit RPN8/RPN11
MRALDARLPDGPLMTPEAVEAFRAHALEACPEECLGFVDRHGDYNRLPNVAPDPEKMAVPPRGTIVRLLAAGNLRALCHSHPFGHDAPTEPDMRQRDALRLPFVLCATDGEATTDPFAWGDELVDDRDLVGRAFRHGVDDCYALVRAYFSRERGIVLPDYPRNWEWWSEKVGGEKDLYRRFFRDAGFEPIEARDVVPGDCWLAAIRSDVPNHAGVVLEGGLALHHVSGGTAFDPSRLSRREPLVRYAPFVTHWLRRTRDCSGPSTFTAN